MLSARNLLASNPVEEYGAGSVQPSGRLLRAVRLNAGYTQADLARRTGLNRRYISQLETGKRTGGVRGWKRLADALGVEVRELVESPSPEEQTA